MRDSEQSAIPPGTEFTVYWCPRCEIQTRGPWHTCERPNPLIPQMDVETECLAAKVTVGGTRS